MFFTPNIFEESLLAEITNRHRTEYVLIRLTETMINKSIIGAAERITQPAKILYHSLCQKSI